MRIAELGAELGITFHDSLLRTLSMNVVGQTVEFLLDVCVGDPDALDGATRERRRAGRLELTGLQYFVVDPPDPSYPYRLQGPLDIDPCDADPEIVARYRIPEGGFAGRFFVSDWNAFIHFAAMDAHLTWLEPE